MLLTQCAACAAPLGLALGKKCSRCSTRYCGPACQKKHWEEGGHDKLCRKIRKGGGAEQFHANKNYAEAVAVAVEKCAEDTKGQTCYICMDDNTKEGLVRGCACGDRDGVASGTSGIAHVSCLVRQAKILVEEGEEKKMDAGVMETRWRLWDTCGLCKHQYHGIVRCALGWACWKTYVGLPETDEKLQLAMGALGNGLSDAKHHEDALAVRHAELSMMQRLCGSEDNMLAVMGNLANTYESLGRHEPALCTRRDIHSRYLNLFGEEHRETLRSAINYTASLRHLQQFGEGKSLLRKAIPVAQRVLGKSDEVTLNMKINYTLMPTVDADATLVDLNEAVDTLENAIPDAHRAFGASHPLAAHFENSLQYSRQTLRAHCLSQLEDSGLSPTDIDLLERTQGPLPKTNLDTHRQRRQNQLE